MVNMNMMGQMPGVQDTSEMALQQAQLQAQFTPQTLQAGQGIYGTPEQKAMAMAQRGTSAGVL